MPYYVGGAGAGEEAIRTATLVVASSESKDKTRADYVCDGVNDEVEINQAINSLPESGGKVLLLEGTYYISSPIRILKNNVVLQGMGNATKLFLITPIEEEYFSGLIKVGDEETYVEGVIIENLEIDGNMNNLEIPYDFGIVFVGYEDKIITKSCIKNCYIHDFYVSGIYLRYASNNIIIGNVCNSNDTGIYIENYSENNIVIGNICNLNYIGIYIAGADNNTVIGNECNNNTEDGIYVSVSNNNSILGNICNFNPEVGIFIDYDSECNTISGNICISNGDGIGIGSSNNIISGNICKSNSGDGVSIYWTSSKTLISENICISNVNGISIYGNENVIIGNKCSVNSDYGIFIGSNSNANLVAKNYLTGNTKGSLVDNGTGTIKGASTDNDNVV